MHAVVTGATGFVGQSLCRRLIEQGHTVTGLGTRADAGVTHPDFSYIQADTTQAGAWQEVVARADVIFNLAGRTIFHRWTKAYRQQIWDSRILTTRNLAAALPVSAGKALISTSAVGYYGDGGEASFTETSPNGSGFLARLSRAWEDEAAQAAGKGVRVVLARFGIVLGKGGGALDTMLPSFRAFIGGPLGSGRQWFSWIHMDDLIGALLFASRQTDLQGPVNLCAPHPVRNADLARGIGQVLRRPSRMIVPSVVLKVIFGEMASMLLAGQRVAPQKLTASGFTFKYPELESALTQILG